MGRSFKDTLMGFSSIRILSTGTCFIQKIYAPSSSLLQGKYLPFPLPHFASIFFAYLWSFRWPNYIATLPRYFSFRLPSFKYTYPAPLRRIGHEYSANVAWSTFHSLKRIQPLPVQKTLIVNRAPIGSEFSRPAMCNNAIMIISSQM